MPQSRWFATNRVIVANAASLISTTGVTSALGFFYWWLAARLFPPAAVGLASAAISAMMLLGSVGVLGSGTLLIGELPRQPGKAGSLITTSLLVAGFASGGLGILFAIAAPRLSAELEPLAQGIESIALFALGVTLTGVTRVLDQALIGLLRGRLQLWRNALFAVVKLIALWVAGIWFANKLGLTIYATWVVGSLVSLAVLVGTITLDGVRIAYRPQWGLIRGLGRAALGHHGLNLALEAVGWTLPIMVTALLSAKANASFYAAWMIASLVFTVPSALTTVLYAVGAAEPAALARKIRLTLKLSLLAGVLGSSVVLISAYQVLRLFGSVYAEQAEWSLRILALGVFPMIIKAHYVAISRVHNRIAEAAVLMTVGSSLELLFAALGAGIGGLSGLSVGLVAALCVEATFTAPNVYRTVISMDVARMAPGK